MNNYINLLYILSGCEGCILYSTEDGIVQFIGFADDLEHVDRPVYLKLLEKHNHIKSVTVNGCADINSNKCILFPSEDQRDWTKFNKI